MSHSKPVYASVPSDMLEIDVPLELLDRCLSISSHSGTSASVSKVSARLVDKVRAAQRPLLIVDALCYPFDFLQEAGELAKIMPTAAFTAGKGVVDETNPNWHGALSGPIDYRPDVVLMLGPLLSDTNTAAWTAVPEGDSVVKFNLDDVEIDDEVHHVHGKAVLQSLVSALHPELTTATGPAKGIELLPQNGQKGKASKGESSSISQDSFWATMSPFLRPNDTDILANGTPLLGGRSMQLPAQTQVVASSVWCSIGQMLPAAHGIALAKRDHDIPGRTILLEGDGSFQVTCQALSDIIRYKLDVTIFILNNGGYTYERWLNGIEAEYNDVPSWRYSNAPSFFGAEGRATGYPIMSVRVEKWSELEEVLADAKLHDGKGLKLVDVVMEAADVPEKSKAGLRRGSEALRV
ncbi:hypothetical protein LTR85_008647 [Meristemomyces frigidus]|nr:hypothetical protein LTR85_008647 [Meristemomyces frigidus]